MPVVHAVWSHCHTVKVWHAQHHALCQLGSFNDHDQAKIIIPTAEFFLVVCRQHRADVSTRKSKSSSDSDIAKKEYTRSARLCTWLGASWRIPRLQDA